MMRSCIATLAFGLALAAVPLPALSHEEELIFGGSAPASGQIMVHADLDQPAVLPVSIFPGLPGYATGELGLHSTVLDDPPNSFYQFSLAADFRLMLLAKDPGMEIWTGTSYMSVGGTFFVGPSPFDTHPLFNIVSGSPGIDYSVTFKLIDVNGIYQDSAPFNLSFTPVPEPGCVVGACALAISAVITRRTRPARVP